jgi:hypothetical protein
VHSEAEGEVARPLTLPRVPFAEHNPPEAGICIWSHNISHTYVKNYSPIVGLTQQSFFTPIILQTSASKKH